MKELSIEEKAKAYDNVVGKLKHFIAQGVDTIVITGADVKDLFPELKESEDEKIRNLCEELVRTCFMNELCTKEDKDECIAWLEKQGDKDVLIKELGEYKVKYTQEVLKRHLNNVSNKDDERLRKTAIAFLKDFADKGYENAVECIDWLEKQWEQKKDICEGCNNVKGCVNCVDGDNWAHYTDEGIVEAVKDTNVLDMVKPKFKVSDWIVNNLTKEVEFIMAIGTNSHGNQSYWLGFENHMIGLNKELPLQKQDDYHLWTLKDAKDGDILVCEDGMPFIFKGFDRFHPECPVAYCGLDEDGKFIVNIGDGWWTDVKVKPANKKQCDLLFQKMKEEYYSWNQDEKKLEKIKQKSSDSYCREHCKGYQETGKCFADGGCDAKREADNKQWSEDDEQYLLVCKNALNKYESTDKWDAHIISHWLENRIKPLKDRVQPKKEWSEEDDRMYNRIISFIPLHLTAESYTTCNDWLKSLKDRIQPQPKQEWSEEDEKMVKQLIKNQEILIETTREEHLCSMYEKEMKWLESLLNKNKI